MFLQLEFENSWLQNNYIKQETAVMDYKIKIIEYNWLFYI